ncbi:Serine decarboxylase 2 [Capsicum annuum]|uniref:Serine decarboxylase 2 n=1 Tax=Capsicum annuum TaxID=4072 RepID=A0A2G2YWV7_CAPAN|nr:Serine decarboxylase 2 [Capsicum annuum]
MYRMEIETINTLVSGEMYYADLRTKLLLNQNKPAIININIGTTFKGAIDDIDSIVQALEYCGYSNDKYYIHCDAALYGLIVSFIKHKPIGSISVSGHKFLGCPIPFGIQMTRKSNVNSLSNIEYIASADMTISGSRNGLAPIFLWYSLSMKGYVGLWQDSKMCIENSQYLKDQLLKEGISVMLNEFSTTVVFERPCDHKFISHWKLCYLSGIAHIVVMSGITREIIDSFLKDLMQERKK